MRFQSTLPREERPLQHQLGLHRRIFQSTLPREERRAKRTCLPKEPSDFNPRSHERSDAHSQRVSVTRSKFQSTLPREERRSSRLLCIRLDLFQSTLPREERQGKWHMHTLSKKFQSTLPREERRRAVICKLYLYA